MLEKFKVKFNPWTTQGRRRYSAVCACYGMAQKCAHFSGWGFRGSNRTDGKNGADPVGGKNCAASIALAWWQIAKAAIRASCLLFTAHVINSHENSRSRNANPSGGSKRSRDSFPMQFSWPQSASKIIQFPEPQGAHGQVYGSSGGPRRCWCTPAQNATQRGWVQPVLESARDLWQRDRHQRWGDGGIAMIPTGTAESRDASCRVAGNPTKFPPRHGDKSLKRGWRVPLWARSELCNPARFSQ
jgi:hypothetical protein